MRTTTLWNVVLYAFHFILQSWNLDSSQVQTLLVACWKYAVKRNPANGPSRKSGFPDFRRSNNSQKQFIINIITIIILLLLSSEADFDISTLVGRWIFLVDVKLTKRSIIHDRVNPCFFFSIRVFFHGHWRLIGQQRKGGDHFLFYSIRSRTFRHLFATLHVRWLSHIFNRNACIYQTATRWDFPTLSNYHFIVLRCEVCFSLFTWWFDTRILLQQSW